MRDTNGLNVGSYRVSLQDDTNNCPVTDTEAPMITLIKPTGGEVIPGGTTYRIQWLSDDNVGVVTHNIALSTDAGKTFASPLASLGGNLQTYDWMVPPDIAPSRTAVAPHHRHRCRRQRAIRLQRPVDPDRLGLHAEQQRHLHLRRPESPDSGIVERRQHHPIHLGRRRQPGHDHDHEPVKEEFRAAQNTRMETNFLGFDFRPLASS